MEGDLGVHLGLPLPEPEGDISRCALIRGPCRYFHYGCDGHDDRGWGCGYRTLQTLSSWVCLNGAAGPGSSTAAPPSLPEIQRALVAMGDKPASFLGSRDWIGACEAAMLLDHLHDVPCRVLHVRPGPELRDVPGQLHGHFRAHGSPVMMGGDQDNASKGVLGVCDGKRGSYLLVLDPHYYGAALDGPAAQRGGWVAWRGLGSLDSGSFYNLCLPQPPGR
ncbi:UFSP1 protease, partial [Atractosteus spatula]|nr:UFSP1 protease [Atractosteus spatula]